MSERPSHVRTLVVRHLGGGYYERDCKGCLTVWKLRGKERTMRAAKRHQRECYREVELVFEEKQ